jgi:dTDP-4-amino-4,6-dideoxygalactose transaminase
MPFSDSSNEFIVFGSPLICRDEINEVVSVMESGWLGTGPKVAQFEADFARYKDIPQTNAAAVNSCTAALHVSMIAAGLKEGDEVITTPMTFCATVNAIIHAGLTPVLADIDPLTMNIDPSAIESAITPKTRAIIPVHFAGRPCDMDSIMAIAEKYNLVVIEDCAHAIETEYKGRKAGTFGDFGCFSFYVTKNVVTGEGGMVIARDQDMISRVKILALHGMSKDAWHRFGDSGYKHYQVVECGFKYNMMDIQAAIGIHQLARVEENWLKRKRVWEIYQDAFSGLPVTLPSELPIHADTLNRGKNTRHAYHLYTVLVDKDRTGISRDEFLEKMTENRIGVGVHYLSIPEHPYYQERIGWKPENYPNAMNIGRKIVSLPISAKLGDGDIQRIIKTVRDILE